MAEPGSEEGHRETCGGIGIPGNESNNDVLIRLFLDEQIIARRLANKNIKKRILKNITSQK